MRKTLAFFYLLLFTLTASATDYDKLWEAVSSAQKKDLPRQVLSAANAIIKTADKEKNYGEYLAAQLCYSSTLTEISADSLEPVINRLKHQTLAIESRTPQTDDTRVLAAVYNAILAYITSSATVINGSAVDGSVSGSSAAGLTLTPSQYYDKALSYPDLLASVKTDAYKRLVTQGKDDYIFNNDLLSLIGNTAGRYTFLKDYYLQHNNRRAACIELYKEILSINSNNDDLSLTHRRQQLLQAINDFSDVPESALLANRYYDTISDDDDISDATRYNYLVDAINKYSNLEATTSNSSIQRQVAEQTPSYVNTFRNDLSRLTLPGFSMKVDNKIHLNDIRNLHNIKVELSLLKADGTTSLSVNTNKERKAVERLIDKSHIFQPLSRSYDAGCYPAYAEHNDSINLPNLPYGVYLIKATADTLTAYCLLHHSDLAILYQPLTKNSNRLVAVSAKTGLPKPGAQIVLTDENTYKHEIKKSITLTCDSKGETTFDCSFSPNRVYVSTADDKAFVKCGYNTYFNVHNYKEERDVISVFTDRAIYRPGQILKGGIIVHNALNEDSIHCVADKKVNITIHDAEYNEIYKDTVITDKMGNAGFAFTIPTTGRDGNYNVYCTAANSISGGASVSVEEYKRPTFQVIAPDSLCDKKYHKGDSVNVVFHAETMTQLPVQNAEVVYSIKRSNHWFWYWRSRRNHSDSRTIADNDTLHTDANGNVTIPLTIALPEEGYGRFNFAIDVKITDAAGETHESSIDLTATRDNGKDSETPHTTEPEFKISSGSFPRDGSPVTITITPSNLQVKSGSATSPNKVANSTSVASTTYIIYTLRAGEKVLEKSSFTLTKPTYTRTFTYNKSYAEGLSLNYAYIKDGKLHSYNKTILKARPDLKLKTTWTTFRDRTKPGSEEKWTLKVENPNSKLSTFNSPLSTLTATVYDSSLDLLHKLHWSMNILHNSYYVSAAWRYKINSSASCSAYGSRKYLNERYLSLASFNYHWFPYGESEMRVFDCVEQMPMMSSRALTSAMAMDGEINTSEEESTPNVRIRGSKVLKAKTTIGAFDVKGNDEEGGTVLSSSTEPEVDLSMMVRSNLGETAFFTPSLVADQDGNLNISFTMPETMTTWRFLGLVHDRQMRYDIVDTTCVAKKDIIVKPNVPRFLREHDKGVLAATISNTTNAPLKADVIMQFLSAGTEKVLWQHTENVSISANGSTSVAFDAPEITEDSLLTYRIVARTADGNSDGEQHLIPVLPKTETVTTTIAFTQHNPGTYSTDLTPLLYKGSTNRKLTFKYVEHAVQMILDAVPTTVTPSHNDAMSLAAAVYVMNLFNIADTAKVTDKLHKLQNTDGSWSWWEGMDGSIYMTTSISRLLARLHHNNCNTAETDNMLSNAMPFMMDFLHKEANELRKFQKKYPKVNPHPSELATDILYINAIKTSPVIGGASANKDIKYLIGLLEKVPTEFTIYGKAHSAAILALYGKTKKAKEFLESLKEYTVSTPEAGRYYDARKAYYSWRNYRIPTEVAAMEAIRIVTPQDTTTIEEMQRWLLHEKRTQRWDTSVNTADAIYAFCLDNHEVDAYKASVLDNKEVDTYKTSVLDSTSVKNDEASASEQDGSVRGGSAVTLEQITLPANNIFTHTKTTTGTSWGSLFLEQKAPLSSIKTTGSGFTITRSILRQVAENNKKTAPVYTTGNKVTVRITINCDRDYDLVTVTDNRPACLEPVEQLSGYHWASNYGTAIGSYSGYYCETLDNQTNYYFNSLSKGTHVIETEYYIDRQGTYHQGTCTVKCEYAPEFSALYNNNENITVGK